MRPQRLILKNFMPFRSLDGRVYEVDFTNLDLFAITGPTGSGKSSLIDAIVWCLYGRTARYGADSKGVISAGENSCEVFFDFTIGPRWFRAVRRTGRTTESGLSERAGDEWIQDVSGAEQLTKRIEALLGLDFAGFTKTVVLPQGEYAQFLASAPKDRRELLAKILELGVYSRVAERAKEVSGRAKARADTIRETLQPYAGVSREQIAEKHQEWEVLCEQLEAASAQAAVLQTVKELADKVVATRARVAELRTEEQRHARAREELHQRTDEATARVAALTADLERLTAEREALRYDPHQHQMLQRAAAHLRAHLAARHEADEKTQLLAKLEEELQELSQQITAHERHCATVRNSYQEQVAALQAQIARHGDATTLTEKIAQAQRRQELLAERERRMKERDDFQRQLTAKQDAVARLRQQEAELEQAVQEARRQYDQARAAEQDKKLREQDAARLGAELQEAVRQEKRVRDQVTEADASLQTAARMVQRCEAAVHLAEQQEQSARQALEEHRRLAAVTHLRQTLQLGAPCPVCQTPVHTLPSRSPEETADLAPFQRAVERAHAELSRAREELHTAKERVATAEARKQAATQELAIWEQKRRETQERFVARFPGFPSLQAAVEAVRAEAQAIAATLQHLETHTQSVERARLACTRRREQAEREEAQLAEALRGTEARLADTEAQLAVAERSLAPYLVAGSDPLASLTAQRQTLAHLQADVEQLASRQRSAEDHLRGLGTQKMQKEGDCRVLASQRHAAQAQAAREAQAVREALALAANAPLPPLTELEQALAEAVQRQQQHAELGRRAETVRREWEEGQRAITALQAHLQTYAQLLAETREKIAVSEQELAQLRTQLAAALQQHQLSGIGSDGEGIAARVKELDEHIVRLRERRTQLEATLADLDRRCREKEREEEKLRAAENEQQLATDLNRLLGADFMDFLSRGAVEILMTDASAHLRRLTHGRYSFDLAYKNRAIELQIVDHEDHKRKRPTHSLSGGETFLASLAIALALAQGFREIATGKAAKTSTECLILDEGFGTLDREGLQLVTETLQELRGEEGRMVGIITHVEEVAAAMPTRIEVRKGNRASTITVLA
ncbi:MAG: SMC family ATPase [Candidatus Binatia bacterium]|nr:SMC family ATPase [Candidatus Binatia bacterium]